MQNDSAGSGQTTPASSSSSVPGGTKTPPPPLKNIAEISAIPNCSKAANAAFTGPVYRGIAGPEATSNDFLPHAILYPGLYETIPPHKRCPFWSLSLYESPTQMRKSFGAIKKTSRNYEKLTGMHCARLDLTSSDGIRTHANSEGHLEFFPYETFDGVKAVVSAEPPAT
jgi:hypothetical protein